MKKEAAKIITIFSCKGGVGKTTLTLNLAGIYSLMDKKVLIMDLDLNSGGIALSLNVNCDKTIFNFKCGKTVEIKFSYYIIDNQVTRSLILDYEYNKRRKSLEK